MSINLIYLACETLKKKLNEIRSKLGKRSYKGTERGNRLLGTAMSMIPKAGCSGFSTALPIAVAGVLENAGLCVDENIVDALPGKDSMKDFVTERAVDSIVLVREAIRQNPYCFLFTDKGNKHGNKNLAKYIAWYDEKAKRVRKYLLDVDCTDEDSPDTAAALYHALKRIWPPELPIIIYGKCTDSGGGGTLYSLHRELLTLGLCASEYFIASCTLHDLQTALRNAVDKVLGLGGIDEDNNHLQTAMQILHGCYNIQNWHEADELKELYVFVRKEEGLEEKFKSLPEPVLTRWWLVGACAVLLKETFGTWQKVLRGVLTYAKANSAIYKIASSTLGLMKKPTILCDHELICTFHSWFLFPHFSYLQKGDAKLGGTPSFLSRHILVRFFVMRRTILNAIENNSWLEMNEFKDLIDAMNKCSVDEKQMQEKS